MSHYDEFFDNQIGGGGRGVHNVFVGSRGQRGHGGVGSFLAGLFRRALPFITKGARAIGKEAVRAGMNILDDVTENNMAFKDSLKSRMSESGLNLKRKASEKINDLMGGSGYKGLAFKRVAQLQRVRRARKKSKSSKKKRSRGKPLSKKKKAIKKKKTKSKSRKTSKKGRNRTLKDIFD